MGRKPFPMTPVSIDGTYIEPKSKNVVIKHTLSWKSLDYLNDASLLPQLKDKGMPVSLVMKDGRARILPDYGRFFWEDSGMYRTFIWEGVNKVSEEEAKRKLEKLKREQDTQLLEEKRLAGEKKEKKFLNDLEALRSIDLNHED